MNDYEQIERQQVVAARAQELSLFYRVLADPDITKNSHIHGLYPDIIVIDNENNVLFIEKVETESSVTDNERDGQWVRYSECIYPFNLIVPSSQIIKARQLINGLNINRLYYYQPSVTDFRFRQVINLNI